MTEIKSGLWELPGSPVGGENPQPLFREQDIAVAAGVGFPADKLPTFGAETGFRILPYTRQDRYDRGLQNLKRDTVVLENEYLKAVFIPAWGGRLCSLYDKKARRELLYNNPAFRPANLAIRDAWASGGIEWNIGRYGHAVHTSSPVFAGVVEDGTTSSQKSSAPVLRIWEFERQTRLFWRVDFSLSERAPILYAYVRIENPDAVEKPLYWWTNTAVPQTEKMRILASTDEVLHFIPGTGNVKTMGGGKLPFLSPAEGSAADASYPALFDFSEEYFFQGDTSYRAERGTRKPYPWEAAVYEDGYAFAEASTAPLVYRKMFCWGRGSGGKRWQEFLSDPAHPEYREYLEVQAGLAPTQLHTGSIAAYGTVDFVQAFTGLSLDYAQVSQKDYRASCAVAEEALAREIGPSVLEAALETGRARAALPVKKLLVRGSAWGALECRARPASMPGAETGCGYPPPGLSFPADSIDGADPWLSLINTGSLPPWPVTDAPPGFPGADDADLWQPLLLLTPRRGDDWLTPYYLGIIDFERGDTEKAKGWWTESLSAAENPWALRNLAVAEQRAGDAEKALEYYRRVFDKFDSNREPPLDKSFTEEFIPLLLDAGHEDEAFSALERRVAEWGRDSVLDGPLVESCARLALARRDDALLDAIFAREPPHVREGNNSLTNIWFARELRRIAEREGLLFADAERRLHEDVRAGKIAVPKAIDFRMYTGS